MKKLNLQQSVAPTPQTKRIGLSAEYAISMAPSLKGFLLPMVFALTAILMCSKASHADYRECDTYYQDPTPAYPCADAEAFTGPNATTTQTQRQTTSCSPSYSMCNTCVENVPVTLFQQTRTVRCTDAVGAAIYGPTGNAGNWGPATPFAANGCVNGTESWKICNL